jgi:hypothetical protein
MNARETVSDYYGALRRGEPLAPYFAARADVVKVGVFSRRVGSDDVAEGFREQRRRTTDWTVDSHALQVTTHEDYARFADRVDLAWTDTVADTSYAFETRWTGLLVPRSAEGESEHTDDRPTEHEWAFVDMHVSAPHARTAARATPN